MPSSADAPEAAVNVQRPGSETIDLDVDDQPDGVQVDMRLAAVACELPKNDQ